MQEFLNLPKQIQLRQLVRFVTITLGSSIFPFMAMYYTTYFGTFWTGLLMMITSLMGFVGTLYGGHLSDALGRKKSHYDWVSRNNTRLVSDYFS